MSKVKCGHTLTRITHNTSIPVNGNRTRLLLVAGSLLLAIEHFIFERNSNERTSLRGRRQSFTIRSRVLMTQSRFRPTSIDSSLDLNTGNWTWTHVSVTHSESHSDESPFWPPTNFRTVPLSMQKKSVILGYGLIQNWHLWHYEPWFDLNQYLGICLSLSWFWVSSWKVAWVWVESIKSPRYCLSHELIRINFSGRHLSSKRSYTKQHFSRKPKRSYDVNTWVENAEKSYEARSKLWMMASLSHELIRANIPSDIFYSWIGLNHNSGEVSESWADFNQNSESFCVVSRFESNSRKPFWVMSWFQSILVKPLRVMSWDESKLSETELSGIKKNWVVPMSGHNTLLEFISTYRDGMQLNAWKSTRVGWALASGFSRSWMTVWSYLGLKWLPTSHVRRYKLSHVLIRK